MYLSVNLQGPRLRAGYHRTAIEEGEALAKSGPEPHRNGIVRGLEKKARHHIRATG